MERDALPWLKPAAGAVWCLLLGWFFLAGRQVPLLSLVDLGFHELGHLLTYPLPWDLVTAAMGSIAQVAVPVGLAGYFFFIRRELVSAGVCLAWAATSSWAVHAYVADAPHERLVLIGGDHDWAFILHELDQMNAAAGLARLVWLFGLVCLASGLLLCIIESPWTRSQSSDLLR